MSKEMLIFWMVVAVTVMLVMDIIEKVTEFRAKKVKKPIEPMMVKPPTIHTVPHNVKTFKIKKAIPVHLTGFEEQVMHDICNEIAESLYEKNLISINRYENRELNQIIYEATIKAIDPKEACDEN